MTDQLAEINNHVGNGQRPQLTGQRASRGWFAQPHDCLDDHGPKVRARFPRVDFIFYDASSLCPRVDLHCLVDGATNVGCRLFYVISRKTQHGF
jgi:hypothetical protein